MPSSENLLSGFTAETSQPVRSETLKRISDEVGLSEKTVSEILRSGFHNMQFVDFYRSYADEDSEESREDVTCDYTFELFSELLRQERSEAVFGALDELSYREREVIRSHIGFCPDCHSMKSPKFRPHTFQEIAYKNELSSAEAAENIYHKGLDKMRDKLKKKGIFHEDENIQRTGGTYRSLRR